MDKTLLEYVEDVLLNRCDNATERLLAYASTIEPKSKPCAVRKKGVAAVASSGGGAASWRDLPVTKRIEHALVKGVDTYIVAVRPPAHSCFAASHLCLLCSAALNLAPCHGVSAVALLQRPALPGNGLYVP